MMAEVIVELVSIALALAWKLRCAVIKSTNSCVKSTLARSVAPARSVPKPALPAVPRMGLPEDAEAKKLESPIWRNPEGLEKLVSKIFASDFCEPLENDALTNPSLPIVTPTKEPSGAPSCD